MIMKNINRTKESRALFPNQAEIQFIPKLSLGDDYDSEIWYRGIASDDGCDWVYNDIDRIYELFVEIKSDKSNLSDAITDFVEYAGGKFGMTLEEEKILDDLIRGFNWDDPLYCMDILHNDITIDVAKFLKKYNFNFSIGTIYDKERA